MTAAERWIFEELFSEDVLLPSQYFRDLAADRPLRSGECYLLAALLADAIRCYQRNYLARDRAGQRLFREAEQWLMECEPAPRCDGSFSFQYVCDVLRLDPEDIRRRLRRWSATQPPRPEPAPRSRRGRRPTTSEA
ncbi:MAG: hypothetical protein KatS3mg077_2635 [Candidatus Binatia bacterium]|nr:MAG: hypothetical protein KatS3mg077_2635 [Candidatus Binatia bacterium]